MIFSRKGAGLLEKYLNHLPDRPSFEELDALAAEVAPGCDGLRLRSNAPDLPVEEMFVGRTSAHRRGHEIRAIMEAVADELRSQVTLLRGPNSARSVRSVGGAARSRVWLEIKREALGCPIEAVDCAETTSLGAAQLAVRHSEADGAGC
jgi:L-fuculokinase